MNKKTIVVVILMLLSNWIISQKIFDPDNEFFPSGGLSFQKNIFGELGLCYGTGDFTCGSCGSDHVIFPKISTEFTVDNKKLILGPKFSVEYVYAVIGARVNIIDYTDFNEQDWRFTPEIGLSVCGCIALYYGYNYPLSNIRIPGVSENRLTLTLTLPGFF